MQTTLLIRCKHGLKGAKKGFDWHNDWHSTVSIKSVKDVSYYFIKTCAMKTGTERRGRDSNPRYDVTRTPI